MKNMFKIWPSVLLKCEEEREMLKIIWSKYGHQFF